MNVDIRGMKSFIFIWAFASVALHVVLKFSFHHTADCDNISADAAVNQVVLDLTVDCFRHLACIYVLDVWIDLLNSDSLEKWSLSRVFFRVEDSAFAVQRDASVWYLPLTINKSHVNLRFAIVALELDGLNEHFDTADSENSSSDAHKLVDQMWLNLGQWVDYIVVMKPDYNMSLILVLAEDVQANWVQRKSKWFRYIVGVVAYKL